MRVLMVEDSPRDAALVERELGKHFDGIELTRVETLEEYTQALSGGEWDVVISDHRLPRFSSTEAMAALRASGKDIPIIVVSGTMGEEFAVEAMRGGARDYLVKRDLHRLGPAVEREIRDAFLRRNLASSERERQRQEAEQALLRERLEIIRRFGNDILLLVGLDGAIVQANDRALAAYGYSLEEILRLNIRDLRAAEAQSALAAQMTEALAGGTRFQTLHRRRDGTTFPAEVSARALEVGGRRYLQSFIRDLTEEHAARAAVEYKAMLLDNLHDSVIGVDAEGRINAWNRATERLLGWRATEVMGQPFAAFLPARYGEDGQEEAMAPLFRVHRPRSQLQLRARGGTPVDVESTAIALRGADGKLLGMVAVNRDVTDRNRAEAALRASQERLARVLATAAEAIWLIDADGRVEFVNDRAGFLFGFDPARAVGRPMLEMVPEVVRGELAADLERLGRGEAVQREFQLQDPRGGRRSLVLSTGVVRNLAGPVEGAVVVVMDLTPLQQAREQLLQAQKMEAVGRLASGIGHDFNNLLVVILSSSGALAESFPPGDPRRGEAQDVLDAGERAAALVRQLLAFARRNVASPVPCDATGVVRGIEKLLRRSIGEDVQVELALEPRRWPTRIDPGHLEQVLMNLAVNARDAMQGGGKLGIEVSYPVCERAPESCPGLAPGRYVLLRVTDTGCGMTPETQARIFEPFFTTKEHGKGTGLGLATVFGIVQEAGGRIAVASAPGEGSTFSVYLPACDDAFAGERQRIDRSCLQGRGRRVLLVEDEADVRRSIRRMLERNGYGVVEAPSGAEGYRALLEQGSVDVVLSDIVMPAGSGDALAAALRAEHRTTPVLLMSGYTDLQGRAGEFGPVLAKPFSEEALLARLGAVLEGAVHPRTPGAAGDGGGDAPG
jgi:PAS domain S-box-containing protein